jgi:predicted enzyme related to lactoylglutathione lyase
MSVFFNTGRGECAMLASAFMKQHLLGIYTAIYHVENLDRARKWYSELLGQKPYFSEPFYVGFNVAGYELGLLPVSGDGAKAPLCVAYWGVKDIAAAAATLEQQGHKLSEPITDVGEGIKTASFLDSEGNAIGLIENPHFPNTAA